MVSVDFLILKDILVSKISHEPVHGFLDSTANPPTRKLLKHSSFADAELKFGVVVPESRSIIHVEHKQNVSNFGVHVGR